jgi:hypothetical protein
VILSGDEVGKKVRFVTLKVEEFSCLEGIERNGRTLLAIN